MAISRSQLVKELEPGLNALSAWSTADTRTNTQKYLWRKLQTERLKKKLCLLGSVSGC
jgi:hypothetical protein